MKLKKIKKHIEKLPIEKQLKLSSWLDQAIKNSINNKESETPLNPEKL